MSMRLAMAFSLAFVAPAIPQQVSAQEIAGDWQRVAFGDTGMSMEFPCREDNVEWLTEGGTAGASCLDEGILYGALVSEDGIGAIAGESMTFDEVAAELGSDPSVTIINDFEFGGRRALRAVSAEADDAMYAQVVELAPGELLMLVVVVEPGSGKTSPDKSAIRAIAERFFATLEMPAR